MILKVLSLLYLYFKTIQAEGRHSYLSLVEIHQEICMWKRDLSECENYLVERSSRKGAGTRPPITLARDSRELQQENDQCCGHCSCRDDCFDHGSCCLTEYKSLENGRIAIESTRYDCVVPGYSTTTRTRIVKPVWLVTKCLPEWQDETIKGLCENPGKDGSLESMVPVTQLEQYPTHYRNKYCAICNGGEDISLVISWMLEIDCQSNLNMSGKHRLRSLTDHKCNIVYKPPNNIKVHECEVIPFTISSCNVTGKWKHYDEMVERGCRSFIDPFNLTYMNYFCYLCNKEDELPFASSLCIRPPIEMKDNVTPPFSATISLDDIKSLVQGKNLECDVNQFNDYKMELCRDIICHEDRYLDNDDCLIDPTEADFLCYSVYVKFTPANLDSTLFLDILRNHYFHQSVQSTFMGAIPNFLEAILKFDISYKRSRRYPKDIADFLMVNIQLIPSSSKTDILNYIFKTLHNRTVELFFIEVPLQLYCECVVPNTSHRAATSSEISNVGREVLESIGTIFISEDYNSTCRHEEAIVFRKVHVCPYVNISLTELSVKIENGLLYITETFQGNLDFSPWEYELNGDFILICLNDYKHNYERLHLQYSSTAQRIQLRSQLLFVVCLSFLVSWLP